MAHLRTKSTAALLSLVAGAALATACSEALSGIPGGAERATMGQLGEADGILAERVAVDADVPAVTNLDPRLRTAVRAAARAAEREGVTMQLTSGWRSKRYQQSLYDEAVRRDGAARAARLVATSETSEHVTGDAVDVGPTDAAYWMDRYSERFGLCRTYANEVWHYELRTGATCPDPVANAAERQRATRN